MLRSMFSAISGLRAHQTKMDVTGNNIANVNTVGFKGSQTVFQDTLSQVIRAGGTPAADRGGTNPAQVGLGVKVAATTTNWTQGATQNTGRSTDFMIEGDGFFVTRAGTESLYTRAGSFDFDGEGKLVAPNGAILQGWMADANGVVNTNGPAGDLSVPYGQIVSPQQTTAGSVEGNLPAGRGHRHVVPDQRRRCTTARASSRRSTTTSRRPPAADAWTLDIQHANGTNLVTGATVAFNSSGVMTTPAAPGTLAPFTPPAATFPGWTGPVTIDLSGMTQFGGAANLVAPGAQRVRAGRAAVLPARQRRHDHRRLLQRADAADRQARRSPRSTTPAVWRRPAAASFRVGVNSGVAMVGTAGTGGRGQLLSGALEMSNVDLAEEFTGLIVAQRGFQANSRVITSSDEILQDLVNLKR